jgi:hypothetical protein
MQLNCSKIEETAGEVSENWSVNQFTETQNSTSYALDKTAKLRCDDCHACCRLACGCFSRCKGVVRNDD